MITKVRKMLTVFFLFKQKGKILGNISYQI